jgi:hypothetical protein
MARLCLNPIKGNIVFNSTVLKYFSLLYSIFGKKNTMRIISIIILCAAITGSGCTGKGLGRSASRNARITFSDTIHNYGEIDFSSDGICAFKFTNTGKGQLVLKNVKSNCGCTVPEWPKEPVPTGDTAEIVVRYDTYRVGSFSKSIYV